MQLICYKCFGTLNQGMEFLEIKLVIYIKNFELVFSILNNCYSSVQKVSSIVKYVAQLVHIYVCQESFYCKTTFKMLQ